MEPCAAGDDRTNGSFSAFSSVDGSTGPIFRSEVEVTVAQNSLANRFPNNILVLPYEESYTVHVPKPDFWMFC